MVATTWSYVRAYLFSYRLCTLRCSFLIWAASKTRREELTDHPSAAAITVTRREGLTDHPSAATITVTRREGLTDHPSAATITVTQRERLTDHPLAASSTLQQCLLIDLTGTTDSFDDHRECYCYWESVTLTEGRGATNISVRWITVPITIHVLLILLIMP